MPKENKIRHNIVSDRSRDNHPESTKEDYNKAAGKAHWVGKSSPGQMESPTGFKLFRNAVIIVGTAVVIVAIVLSLVR